MKAEDVTGRERTVNSEVCKMGASEHETGSTLIATALIEGPEARGKVSFWRLANGALKLTIADYWVKAAPDPHLFLSSRADDAYDPDASVHLGLAPTDTDFYSRDLPEIEDLSSAKTFLVYCVEYDVFFGSGRIEQADAAH